MTIRSQPKYQNINSKLYQISNEQTNKQYIYIYNMFVENVSRLKQLGLPSVPNEYTSYVLSSGIEQPKRASDK